MDEIRYGSLFAGIGGFDLAADWLGWEGAFAVEKNKWRRRILAKNFPLLRLFRDIYDFDGSDYEYGIDVLCGGFPCQPFSIAGNRKGNEDDRYLWGEMLRVIQEVKPVWVVAENVPGIISQGGGMVVRQVFSDLGAEGFELLPLLSLPSAGQEGGSQRDRIFFVAYSHRNADRRKSGSLRETENKNEDKAWQRKRHRGKSVDMDIEIREGISVSDGAGKFECGSFQADGNIDEPGRAYSSREQLSDEIVASLFRMVDGVPRWMDRHRRKRIKALGAAVDPYVAYSILKVIDGFLKEPEFLNRFLIRGKYGQEPERMDRSDIGGS